MRLYPDNPHYIELRGKPALLVGSGEHYGSILNTDFDYIPYLANLSHRGLNQLRIFSGTYREIPGEFGILHNNLAPRSEAFLSPWVQTPDGKFDLSAYNPAYFARLHGFLGRAGAVDIAVELVLFCFWYNDALWQASPMHPANNEQGIGPEAKEGVYALQGNNLLAVQEALVQKLVHELNGYDTLYFEICNEPYSRHDHSTDLDWQNHIARLIASTETTLPQKHLVAVNYENRTQRIPFVDPAVSICNFHYALPEAVKENHHFDRVIADDETGFLGQSAEPYRREAWSFFLAGGGIFSHLDYSFTVDHPDGSAPIEGSTPGYGGEDLRMQLAFLRKFLEENEVWKLRPYNEIFAWNVGIVNAQAMCDPGRLYLAYFSDSRPGINQLLALPSGYYQLEWINPVNGNTFLAQSMHHTGGYLHVGFPQHSGDLLLKMLRH
jgi:hypothetical protein